MTYNEQLDIALKFLAELNKKSDGSFFYFKPFNQNEIPADRNFPNAPIDDEITSRLITHLDRNKVTEPYRYPIIQHLIRDKYVDDSWSEKNGIKVQSQIRINLSGLIFIERNGYVGKRNRELSNHLFHLITTIVIAVGAIGVLLMEVWKYCQCGR